MDRGAINHMIVDMNNLAIKSHYKQKDHITISNDQTLKISQIGSVIINSSTTSHSLILKNILLVLEITKNL